MLEYPAVNTKNLAKYLPLIPQISLAFHKSSQIYTAKIHNIIIIPAPNKCKAFRCKSVFRSYDLESLILFFFLSKFMRKLSIFLVVLISGFFFTTNKY